MGTIVASTVNYKVVKSSVGLEGQYKGSELGRAKNRVGSTIVSL